VTWISAAPPLTPLKGLSPRQAGISAGGSLPLCRITPPKHLNLATYPLDPLDPLDPLNSLTIKRNDLADSKRIGPFSSGLEADEVEGRKSARTGKLNAFKQEGSGQQDAQPMAEDGV
jgi:hypothetical protein